MDKMIIEQLEIQKTKYMDWIQHIEFDAKLYAMYHQVSQELLEMKNLHPTKKEIKFSLMGHLYSNYPHILYSNLMDSHSILYNQVKNSLFTLCETLNIKISDNYQK